MALFDSFFGLPADRFFKKLKKDVEHQTSLFFRYAKRFKEREKAVQKYIKGKGDERDVYMAYEISEDLVFTEQHEVHQALSKIGNQIRKEHDPILRKGEEIDAGYLKRILDELDRLKALVLEQLQLIREEEYVQGEKVLELLKKERQLLFDVQEKELEEVVEEIEKQIRLAEGLEKKRDIVVCCHGFDKRAFETTHPLVRGGFLEKVKAPGGFFVVTLKNPYDKEEWQHAKRETDDIVMSHAAVDPRHIGHLKMIVSRHLYRELFTQRIIFHGPCDLIPPENYDRANEEIQKKHILFESA